MPDAATRCAYCHTILRSTAPGRPTRMLTRDHIMPRRRGRLPDGVRSTRAACARCNQLRARCRHCPAAALLALHFAPAFGGDPLRAARWLGVADA